MTLDAIKELVGGARQHLEAYNEIADKLAAAGVTIELDTRNSAHGVVGIGRVDAKQIDASFTLEL